MAELVLYNTWRSSSSYRVRIALAMKGLAYTYMPVDLVRGEQAKADHAARSPTRQVPCLTIDGVAYIESVAIIELLDERFPLPSLYPADTHGRARVRSLVEIVNSGTQPFQNLRTLLYRSSDREVQRAWGAHFVEEGLGALERAMQSHAGEGVDGRFAYGDEPTAADVFLVPQVYSASRFFDLDLAPFARVRAAFDAAMELDTVKQAAPELQPDAARRP